MKFFFIDDILKEARKNHQKDLKNVFYDFYFIKSDV